MVESKDDEVSQGRSPWITAWSDPVSGINSFSQLMCFSDLKDDGDFKLLTADYSQKRLKVFMGTNCFYTTELQNRPTALTTFYDSNSKPSKFIRAISLIPLHSDSDYRCGTRAPDLLLQRLCSIYALRSACRQIFSRGKQDLA